MTTTLKEKYEVKRLSVLKKRLTRINHNVITENKRDLLIFEAFDKQQMMAATDIIKKLGAIQFGAMTSLAQARDLAINDVTKALGGKSQSQGLVNKIVNLFKNEKENPLVDTIAFSSALNNFFELFSQYVSALPGAENVDQTLETIITGKSDKELGDIDAQNSAVGAVGRTTGLGVVGKETKQKLADLQKVILTGFKPEGNALANLGTNWIDKYLKGKKGLQLLAKDMLKMKIKDLTAISNSVISAMKNVDAVGQAAAGASQQGSVKSTETTGSSTSGSATSTTGSTGTKSKSAAPGAQVSNVDDEKVKKMGEKLGPIIAAVKNNKFNLNLLAKKLVKAGLDPDNL